MEKLWIGFAVFLRWILVAPITFVAYAGEKVTPDGTEPINSSWEKYKGSIYWRVDAIDAASVVTTGDIWSFTTE